MNRKAIGFLLIFLLTVTAASAGVTSPDNMNTPAQENKQYENAGVKTVDFTLNIYYRGTIGVGYLIDGSYKQFDDLVQGRDSYDLGEGQKIRVIIYKGTSKFNIDYRKITAVLFADGKQVAGGSSLDEYGRIILTYELK